MDISLESDAFEPIGASDDKTAQFREMTTQELLSGSFNDYFRFSFTLRCDRDTALVLSHKVEAFVANELSRDVRVYVGVTNRPEHNRD